MKPPKIIYLQIGEDADPDYIDDWRADPDITWCVDKINDTDIKYVLAEDVNEGT